MPIVVETIAAPLGDGLSGKDILDAVSSHIQDKSTTMRGLLALWLNTLFQKALNEREWQFLFTTISTEIENNRIIKPSDFGRLEYAKGSGWFLEPKNRMTGREVYDATDESANNPTPVGFEETQTSLNLIPGASGTATLRYVRLIPAASDTTTRTAWPWSFLPLFERSLLSVYYEYDADARGVLSLQLDTAELDRLKYQDNLLRPIPKRSNRGYVRNR
jgi:hypothetical protein